MSNTQQIDANRATQPARPAAQARGAAARPARPSPSRAAAEHLLEEQMLRTIAVYLRSGVIESH